MRRKFVVALGSLALLSSINLANAAQPCPLEPFDPAKGDVDVEFGSGAIVGGVVYDVSDNTVCAQQNKHKLVLQVDNNLATKYDPVTGKAATAPWISTRKEMLRNYQIQGMTYGKEVEIVAVLSTVGATLATKSHPRFAGANADPNDFTNPFASEIVAALDSGIQIYVCQTAARALGIKAANLIDPRIKFVPGGHIAVADFQQQGYAALLYK
jgi:intracellular sulfur oxidation DsrE/DsrF family protein